MAKVKDPGVEEDAMYDAVDFRKSSKIILNGKSALLGFTWICKLLGYAKLGLGLCVMIAVFKIKYSSLRVTD